MCPLLRVLTGKPLSSVLVLLRYAKLFSSNKSRLMQLELGQGHRSQMVVARVLCANGAPRTTAHSVLIVRRGQYTKVKLN